MSCKHPLKAFKIGVNPETGNDINKVVSYKVHHLERKSPQDNFEYVYDDTYAPNRIYYNDWQEIPCGQCINCRLDYSRQWANRCALEMKYHKVTQFVTLTYNDENLPSKRLHDFVDPITGEVSDITVHSLQKKDFQDFMKELRYYYPDNKIRYFAAGEYGSESARPHYHAIIFGLDLNDLTFYKTVRQGGQIYNYYNSETIQKAWKNKGFCVITQATWETVAYTARYCTKKLNGEMKDFYDVFQIEPEFVLMSRKPGIGAQYFDDNYKDIFNHNEIVISNLKGSRTVAPPRYFKKALEKLEPEWYNDIKLYNKAQADIVNKIKMQKTSLSYLDYLQVEEDNLKNKLVNLQRNKV